MKKILIDNCVPLNNGDAALIMGLFEQLANKDYEIGFSCLDKSRVKQIYPNFTWYKSHINTLFYKLCFKKNLFAWLWKVVMFIRLVWFDNEYKQSDVVISAPGGYIHSYYGIEARMYILYLCKIRLHKRVGIYSQSIGKLSKHDQVIFKKYGQNLDFIFARDEISYKRSKEYGLTNNLTLTKDAAFLLKKDNENNEGETPIFPRIAISLRSWTQEGRNMDSYFAQINTAISYLLKNNYDITFLSTCQGIENYVDDSEVAKAFVKHFNYAGNQQIHINDDYHNLNDLQALIKKFDFVIGTRLHMCLLSWINNVPAFNISYEEKGRESYKYLGLDDYTTDFNASDILIKLPMFLKTANKQELFDRVEEISKEQKELFARLEQNEFEGIS